MNSGIMTVHHNDTNKSINDTYGFCQYHSLLISGHEGNTLHPITTQVITEQLDGGSNFHVFTSITIFTYIIPVKYNVQIINGIKAPEKGFGLVIIKFQK